MGAHPASLPADNAHVLPLFIRLICQLKWLIQPGRISGVIYNDREIQKEFELLGAQVAIPILDRETLLGVAVFDGRITGEPLTNSELELIFRLLEQLGLAVKNIWLHDQLAGNHEMMAQILRDAGDEIIEREDLPSFRKQTIANVRTKKSRCTSDHRAHEASEKAVIQSNVGAAD